MSLEQWFPKLYGKRHGYLRNLDKKAFERGLRSLDPLDRYFRVEFHGLNNIPEEGGGLIVGNHGPFGLDAPFIVKHVYEQRGRIVRPLADRAVFKMPLYRIYAQQMGIVEGEPNQAVEMLGEGSLMSVYPGGLRETVKRPDEKYQIRKFWENALGFVRVALKAQVPIIPVACIGIDEIVWQARTAEEMRDTWFMRRWQEEMGHEKYTAPLFVGLGPLPRPVKLTYYVGRPIHLGYGPEAAENKEILIELREKVMVELERLIEYGLAERKRRHERWKRLLGRGSRRLLTQAQQAQRQFRKVREQVVGQAA